MAGKICLVTGATAGIGEVTARELARRGACVVIVGRSQQRCEAAAEAIRRQTGNPAVELLVADLSSQAEVRRVAGEFLARHDRLHVLVNNVGAMFAYRRESVDGIEMTLALNHLSYFLLTNLLLDTLKASAPARVVNVSSRAHVGALALNMDDLQARLKAQSFWGYGSSKLAGLLFTLVAPLRHPGFVQYARSKLANLLFTAELARRLDGTGVTVNALHPGFVASRFMEGNGSLGWFMRLWAGLLAISAEEGAKTSVYLATSPEVEGVTGKYFARCREVLPSAAARDEEAARRLWELSEELTLSHKPQAPATGS
jgi:NAD(P)-dependent dehydrogenase (short-subunit alcohol dehydrogenase family)